MMEWEVTPAARFAATQWGADRSGQHDTRPH